MQMNTIPVSESGGFVVGGGGGGGHGGAVFSVCPSAVLRGSSSAWHGRH